MNRAIFFMLACLNCFFIQANPNPQKFQGLPRADDQGIVVGIKRLNIEGIPNPFNGSIVNDIEEGTYQLFFRNDDRDLKKNVFIAVR